MFDYFDQRFVPYCLHVYCYFLTKMHRFEFNCLLISMKMTKIDTVSYLDMYSILFYSINYSFIPSYLQEYYTDNFHPASLLSPACLTIFEINSNLLFYYILLAELFWAQIPSCSLIRSARLLDTLE